MVTVSPATPGDAVAIAALLAEVESYYGAVEAEAADVAVANVRAALFGPQPAAYVLLARDGDQAVGIAAYSWLWPAAGTTRSLFLKELYVRDAYRGTGAGRQLMAAVAAAAIAAGCERVEWQADDDNPTAVRFYDGIGMQPKGGKHFYRVDPVTLAQRVS